MRDAVMNVYASVLAGGQFPDSDPVAPPGRFSGAVELLIGVLKWGLGGAAVIALIALGIMMMFSGQGEGQRHLGKGGRIILGVAIGMGAASLLTWLFAG